MEKTNCILCDGDDTKILVAIPGIVTGSCGGCNLVQCEHCSLVYVNPRPTLEELWSYYDEKYKTHLDDYAAISDQERNEDNYYLGRVKLLLNQLSTGFDSGRLLDVGCGDGYWLYLMQKRGWETTGVEVSPQAAQFARERYNLDVRTGHLFKQQFPTSYFDFVTFWHSLEHHHDPISALQESYHILRMGGSNDSSA